MTNNRPSLERRVAEASAALREHQLTTQRCAELKLRHHELGREVADLRAKLVAEEHDVQRLESMSLNRIVAALRGNRDDVLAREKAEADAAKYRVAGAVSREAMVWQELQLARSRLAQLSQAPRNYAAVLDQKERHLRESDDDRASILWHLADERGRLTGEQREVNEALQAAGAAAAALQTTLETLGNAGNWSTYDVFLGGGAVAGMMKHSRLDEAAQAAARADRALTLLRTELADVDGVILTAPQLAVDGFTRFADIWFDDLFSDLAVRNRIRQAQQNVGRSMTLVQGVERRLKLRGQDIRTRLSVIERERQEELGRS